MLTAVFQARLFIQADLDEAQLKVNDEIPLGKQFFLEELDGVDSLSQVAFHHFILVAAIIQYFIIVVDQFEADGLRLRFNRLLLPLRTLLLIICTFHISLRNLPVSVLCLQLPLYGRVPPPRLQVLS